MPRRREFPRRLPWRSCRRIRGGIGRMAASSLLDRSEEHTSELQSLRHLVCRLLLEKKKLLVFLAILRIYCCLLPHAVRMFRAAGPLIRAARPAPAGQCHPLRVLAAALFFFKDTAPTEIYPLSLPDALPICSPPAPSMRRRRRRGHKWTQCHSSRSSDRKSTRLNSSHLGISYAVFCLKK